MALREEQFETVGEFLKDYKPSLGEAVSAWSGSAAYGEGTAYFNVLATESATGEPLDQDKWKASPYYRDGLEFQEGLAENQWANNAKLFDERENRNFILSKTSTAQDVVGFMAAFGVGVVEPQNAAIGAGVGLGIGALARSGYRVFDVLKKASQAKSVAAQAAIGAGEGVVATAVTEPLNLYAADKAGSDYDIADSAWNLLTSTAFGAGLRAGGQKYINHMESKQVRMREKEIMSAAAAEGKALPIEQVQAFVDVEQKRDLTIERDSYIKQREETVAKLSEAEQANVRLYDDYYDIQNNKAIYAYGIDDPQIINALEVIRTNQKSASDKSLLKFLKSKGGVRNEGAELSTMGITSRTMPGLVNNKKGLSLDDAAELAQEAGFIKNRDVRELLDALDESNRGLKKTDDSNDKVLQEAQKFLDEEGIAVGEYLDKYNKAAPELDKEAAMIQSKITSPDIISHLRSSIAEVDAVLKDFPPDSEILPLAKAGVQKMLGQEEIQPYNRFLSQEDISRMSDEQKLLLDKVDEYQETGQLDEFDIAEAENAIEVEMQALNAARLCLTGN